MGWSAQYFTTIIIQGDTSLTGVFIYNGTPGLGTLVGAWVAAAGQDAFGNTVVAGINVNQGNLTGVNITQSTATVMSILASTIANSTINGSTFNQGQINETTIIFDNGGGVLFGYTSTTTTVSQTVNGSYTFTSPITGTGSVSCWGAGQGGDGGNTSEGGSGGNAGEYAGEPNYPLVNAQNYLYSVGQGGGSNTTGNGHGGDGSDSLFDVGGTGGGVIANAGTSAGPGTGSTNSVHFDGGAGGAASGFGGGASGANSGNSTSAGNNGISSTSNTHAGSPVPQTGSGTGGAGSDAGTSPASTGGNPGGGGGGAGQGTGTGGTLTKTYEVQFTASFYGPDATGGNANDLRSTSTLYQGGETSGGGSFNGNQRAVMVFNSNQIASDFAGYTGTQATLKLSNLHSWYNSGMLIDIDIPNVGGKVTSPPSSWPNDIAGGGPFTTVSIGEGQVKSFNLGSSVAQHFINNDFNFLSIGAFVASQAPYNLSYYGYFTGGHGTSLELTISGSITVSGSNTSGAGADGKVTITYATASVLEFALAPQAGSDANSNAFAAGYTGPVNAFHPGSSPTTVEAWTDIPLDTGWTAVSGQTPKYRMLPTGDIEFSGAATHASFTIAQNLNGSNPLPVGYRPVSNHYVRTSNGTTVADTFYQTTGVIQGLGQASGSVQIRLDGVCPLN